MRSTISMLVALLLGAYGSSAAVLGRWERAASLAFPMLWFIGAAIIFAIQGRRKP